jgi:hypothetical protein
MAVNFGLRTRTHSVATRHTKGKYTNRQSQLTFDNSKLLTSQISVKYEISILFVNFILLYEVW